jgi:predicted AlkP superfamily phosphohydrolase/phosphomutase
MPATKASKRRVCVVGLDGVPRSLLDRLASEGVMPNVGQRIAAGHLRSMRASLPEISSVSWSSFMTGVDPGQHGIFGFTDLDRDSYELRFPCFRDLHVPTFWDRLGKAGLRSIVVNQPSTYPARTIPGSIVSGFVAIDLARSVKPLRHLGPLRRMDYQIDIDTARARSDHDFLLADLERTLVGRLAALDYFWEAENWDYFQIVITGTDRLYHFLWDALEDTSHPHHQAVLDYHAKVDDFVGLVYERFERLDHGGQEHGITGSGDGFFMLSDHGFCGIVQEVQLNAWLQREGFLELQGLMDLTGVSPGSRAFALDPGRIYIHRKGRYARGGVDEEEVPALKALITEKLLLLEWEGERIIREVFDAEQIYDGPCVAFGPDLVALSKPGFDLKCSPQAQGVFGHSGLVGMHTWDDAFLLSAHPVGEGEFWIGDVAGILMAEMGL